MLSGRNYILASIPMIFVLANLAMAIVYVVRAFAIATITAALVDIRPESAAINGLAAGADIVIAAMMLFLLGRKRTGVMHNDRVVTRLMIYTVYAGLITSLAAIATLMRLHVAGRAKHKTNTVGRAGFL
ncbi:hypothetical protein D9619_012573 [Psilocybe cf. subviscida]|uniref:DUF6534 domain-containing protein n=1 Tax=Psilocybe cf. subviscida TaxID=2480587 RepID=A0A8H5B6Q4_9AGAR|nr:hypothetical protein D9619_012573 [Psilocybe cf. subviscida]